MSPMSGKVHNPSNFYIQVFTSKACNNFVGLNNELSIKQNFVVTGVNLWLAVFPIAFIAIFYTVMVRFNKNNILLQHHLTDHIITIS